MSACPAIIAALPREVEHLVRGWPQQRLSGKIIVYTGDVAIVACAGMGSARAALAVEAAMSARQVTSLLSVGLAGACDPALHIGDMIHAHIVIDTQSGERFRTSLKPPANSSQATQVLVSTPVIASVQQKQRLFATYAASAVDMEAATVARIARAHNLPFQAIKVISDDAAFELQELSRFATPDGQFREAAFAAYSAVRPRLWHSLLQLAQNSKRALQALTAELQSQLDLYSERSE